MTATDRKPRLSLLAFARIKHDARVLRQIAYLRPHFRLTVVGYPASRWTPPPGVTLKETPPPGGGTLQSKARTAFLLAAGRFASARAYEHFYWSQRTHRAALGALQSSSADLIHANDWATLPIAARVREQEATRLLLDLHEYAPAQRENRRSWRLLVRPQVDYFLRRYAGYADAFVTVGETIARRYEEVYGFRPKVVMNCPQLPAEPAQPRPVSSPIRLVHHGVAAPGRQLERTIRAVAQAGPRFHLHFLLVGPHHAYRRRLEALARQLAPERIFFEEPVRPDEVVPRISQYDVGIFVLPANTFNHYATLPNKFFDFLNAGLAVAIGPSPEMRRLVEKYHCGVVSPSFAVDDVAHTLEQLTDGQLMRMKRQSVAAREELNADVEMGRLVALHKKLARAGGFL